MKKLIYSLPLLMMFSGCSGAGFSGGNIAIPVVTGIISLFFIARLIIGKGDKVINGAIAIAMAAVAIGSFFLMRADN